MGFLSKFGFRTSSSPAPAPHSVDPVEVVRVARVSARRRLIGAALLLGAGIVGFPLLFETQPRPIPVDIPIEIPSRESAAPLVTPATRTASARQEISRAPVTEPVAVAAPRTASAVQAPKPSPQASASARATAEPPSEPKPAPKPETKPSPKPDPKPEPKPVPKPEPKPPETKPAPKPTDALAENGRFVVQVGAYLEVQAAREARQKLESMGYKTYTQVIESDTGRRIRVRVGPYPTKAEADKIATRIKSSGMQAAVLLL